MLGKPRIYFFSNTCLVNSINMSTHVGLSIFFSKCGKYIHTSILTCIYGDFVFSISKNGWKSKSSFSDQFKIKIKKLFNNSDLTWMFNSLARSLRRYCKPWALSSVYVNLRLTLVLMVHLLRDSGFAS